MAVQFDQLPEEADFLQKFPALLQLEMQLKDVLEVISSAIPEAESLMESTTDLLHTISEARHTALSSWEVTLFIEILEFLEGGDAPMEGKNGRNPEGRVDPMGQKSSLGTAIQHPLPPLHPSGDHPLSPSPPLRFGQ